MGHKNILSSYRVHIERKEKCREFDEFESRGHNDFEPIVEGHHDELCNCECGFGKDMGYDSKRDRVIIDIQVDCKLDEQTCYTLILAQPVPVDGYNLPVDIRVHYCDTKKVETIRLIRTNEPWGAVGDLEYGQDLPKCRNRIPLYFTNGREFVDLRKRCCNL